MRDLLCADFLYGLHDGQPGPSRRRLGRHSRAPAGALAGLASLQAGQPVRTTKDWAGEGSPQPRSIDREPLRHPHQAHASSLEAGLIRQQAYGRRPLVSPVTTVNESLAV
jgi:hypothetical protein